MSKSEIKCPNCGLWTPGNQTHCIHCGELVDHKIIAQQERTFRAQEKQRIKEANPTRFEKMLKRLQHSPNPVVRFFYHVLNVIWMIYMGLVAFVIWFTAIFSG